MTPAYSRFMQLGYVTNDLAAARATMRDRYGVREFVEMEADFVGHYHDRSGPASLTLALANVEGVQIELVLPRGGLDDVYTEVLGDGAGYRLVLHHVGVRVDGSRDDWDARLASFANSLRAPVWSGEVGEDQAFCYCDDRASLGHYTEYLWWNERGMMAQPGLIPYNA